MRLKHCAFALGLAVVLVACATSSDRAARVTTTSTLPQTTTTTSDGFCEKNFPTGPDRADCDELHVNGYVYTPPTPEESLRRQFDFVTHSPGLRSLMLSLGCTLAADASFDCPNQNAYDVLESEASDQAQCQLMVLSDESAALDCDRDGQPG
jgi:hypothetical protein